MAFNDPQTFALITQPIGIQGIQIWSYQTDDSISEVMAAGYFTDIATYGAHIGDMVLCVASDGSNSFAVSLTSIDIAGDGSAVHVEDLPLASQEEAEEGTGNVSLMTPLRTNQAIDAYEIEPSPTASTVPMSMVNMLGSYLTTDNFGIPNDGVTAGDAQFTAMLEAMASDPCIVSVKIPAGEGIVMAGTGASYVWTSSSPSTIDRKFELYGAGRGLSRIISRTQSPAVYLEAQGAILGGFFNIHDFSFSTDIANAGSGLILRRTVPIGGDLPSVTAWPEAMIRSINFRVLAIPAGSPTLTRAYWGDFALQCEGWHRAEVQNIWIETPRMSNYPAFSTTVATTNALAAQKDVTVASLGAAPNINVNSVVDITLDDTSILHTFVTAIAGSTITVNDNLPFQASIGNTVRIAPPFDNEHDSYYLASGLGGLKQWNSYGPTGQNLYIQGYRYGILQGHDFAETPEGGAYRNIALVANLIGYRSAAHDYQPGVKIDGNHINCRDYNVKIGGAVTTGTATAGSATTLTLEREPPRFRTTLTAPAAGAQKDITVNSLGAGPCTNVGQFIEITLDDASIHRSFITAIAGLVITVNTDLPSVASAGNSVSVSVLGRDDVVYLAGGTGLGQQGLITNWDGSTKVLTCGAGWTGGRNLTTSAVLVTNPAAYTRYSIESVNVIGGAQNCTISNVRSWNAHGVEERSDSVHGVLNPIDFDLTEARGSEIRSNNFHYGEAYINLHRRMVAVGSPASNNDLVFRGNTIDGNCEYILYNPIDDLPISWSENDIIGDILTRPIYNGNFVRFNRGSAALTLHTGGVGARTATDGAEKTPNVMFQYYCELLVPGNEPISATGLKLLNGTVVDPLVNIIVVLWDALGEIVTSSAATAQGTASTLQAIPFASGPIAVLPGLYFAGVLLSGTTGHFRAHTFGTFRTGSQGLTTTMVPRSIATPATGFTADVGPIASLY